MRTIDWVDGAIELLDQRLLPDRVVRRRIHTLVDLVEAIRTLAVRGAPALGVAGALGVAMAAQRDDLGEIQAAAEELRRARPTAANLAVGVDRALAKAAEGSAAVLAEALAVRDEDLSACLRMGDRGAALVRSLTTVRPVVVMTICNTGGLAAVERGTALGVAQTLYEQGDLSEVLVLETRPLLQGARLTAWELARMGARHRVLVDSAGPSVLALGYVDIVLVGADRIAANGDVANKVGTYALALGAQRAGVPFVVVAPETTLDPDTASGADIVIEDRDGREVVTLAGRRICPAGTQALNPAFDVTPADLVTAVVTEQRVVRLDRGERLGLPPAAQDGLEQPETDRDRPGLTGTSGAAGGQLSRPARR
ncbi:MAG TPA: S-methyl-5-thioribose-1-phosphate isomerase [Dermatophilaceae bacterium]|nr:S-methyl-5-thioribose-1-phosphate isomerase [Dermatophilaceae bacterium]